MPDHVYLLKRCDDLEIPMWVDEVNIIYCQRVFIFLLVCLQLLNLSNFIESLKNRNTYDIHVRLKYFLEYLFNHEIFKNFLAMPIFL